MILALILIPALAAAATLVIPNRQSRWAVLILTAATSHRTNAFSMEDFTVTGVKRIPSCWTDRVCSF